MRKFTNNSCIFADCDEEVFAMGMCCKHYYWDRYHTMQRHGVAYFFGYVARHKELAARGTQLLRSKGATKKGTQVRKRQHGFTLIELLIVVAIIGIIAAIAIPNLLNAIDRGKQKKSMMDIRTIGSAVEAYSIDSSMYPTVNNIGDLADILEPIYIRTVPERDGWSRSFAVTGSQTDFTIGSAGKDGGALTLVSGGGPTSDFDAAIIWNNGAFRQWPEGYQE